MSTQSGESEQSFGGMAADPLAIFDPPSCDPAPVMLPAPIAEWGNPVIPGGLVMSQDNGVSSLGNDRLRGQEAIVQMAETSGRSCYCPNGDPPVHVDVRDPPFLWHLCTPVNPPVPSMEYIRQTEMIQHAAIMLAMQLRERRLFYFGQPVDPWMCQPSDPLEVQENIVQLAEAIRHRRNMSRF